MRMLLIEDDPVSLRLLSEVVKPYGEFDTASNGRQAVELFKQAHTDSNPYDVLFVDIMLPELDGRAALRQVREYEDEQQIRGLNRVKAIMTTALSDSKNVHGSFFIDGCDGYIVKPYRKEAIVDEIRRLGLLED